VIKLVEMTALSPSHDGQLQVKCRQSIEFLRSQQQELVGNLHEEIDRLKRKNRGLVCRVVLLCTVLGESVQHNVAITVTLMSLSSGDIYPFLGQQILWM